MASPLIRQEVLALLLRETPEAFWRSATFRMKWAYGEGFEAVDNDRRILPNQKSAKLLDERFYLAERALNDAALESGLITSGQTVPINGWVYTFVRSGPICLIQSYVPTPDDFARPAKFKEQHAAMNTFLSRPQFAFGDISPKLFDIAEVAGILIHGPVGKRFERDSQKMAFSNFAVPSEDYRRWEINVPLAEIVSLYEAQPAEAADQQRDIAAPIPRRDRKTGDAG